MKKYSKETVVGIFMVFGILAVAYMTVKLGNVGFLGDNSYLLYARFDKVTGLKAGNTVSMLGLPVGRVEGFQLDQKNLVAMVKLRIDKGIKIYDDALAAIKTEGLIGDKYVSIDPGGSGDLLKPGAVITDTSSPIDLGDLISKYAFGDVGKK